MTNLVLTESGINYASEAVRVRKESIRKKRELDAIREANMKGTEYTEYVFEIAGTVKVTVKGLDTLDNYEKAEKEAFNQLYREQLFDDYNITNYRAEEFTDYEDGE